MSFVVWIVLICCFVVCICYVLHLLVLWGSVVCVVRCLWGLVFMMFRVSLFCVYCFVLFVVAYFIVRLGCSWFGPFFVFNWLRAFVFGVCVVQIVSVLCCFGCCVVFMFAVQNVLGFNVLRFVCVLGVGLLRFELRISIRRLLFMLFCCFHLMLFGFCCVFCLLHLMLPVLRFIFAVSGLGVLCICMFVMCCVRLFLCTKSVFTLRSYWFVGCVYYNFCRALCCSFMLFIVLVFSGLGCLCVVAFVVCVG